MPGRAGTALGRGVGAGVEARARLLGLARATRGARRGGDLRVLHGGCRRWISRGRLVLTAEGPTGGPPLALARAPRLYCGGFYRGPAAEARAGASSLSPQDSSTSRGRLVSQGLRLGALARACRGPLRGRRRRPGSARPRRRRRRSRGRLAPRPRHSRPPGSGARGPEGEGGTGAATRAARPPPASPRPARRRRVMATRNLGE